jgi:hypothetical protein
MDIDIVEDDESLLFPCRVVLAHKPAKTASSLITQSLATSRPFSARSPGGGALAN